MSLKVRVKGELFFGGKLFGPVEADETMWTLGHPAKTRNSQIPNVVPCVALPLEYPEDATRRTAHFHSTGCMAQLWAVCKEGRAGLHLYKPSLRTSGMFWSLLPRRLLPRGDVHCEVKSRTGLLTSRSPCQSSAACNGSGVFPNS